jgi:hypothetical protein
MEWTNQRPFLGWNIPLHSIPFRNNSGLSRDVLARLIFSCADYLIINERLSSRGFRGLPGASRDFQACVPGAIKLPGAHHSTLCYRFTLAPQSARYSNHINSFVKHNKQNKQTNKQCLVNQSTGTL